MESQGLGVVSQANEGSDSSATDKSAQSTKINHRKQQILFVSLKREAKDTRPPRFLLPPMLGMYHQVLSTATK